MALAVVIFLIPAVKRIAKGEPLDGVAIVFLCLSFIYFVWILVIVGRQKSGGGSGPPSA